MQQLETAPTAPTAGSPTTGPRPAQASATAERPRGLEIALLAFEEGARMQREAREAAGKPLVGEVPGFGRLQRALLEFLETIPWQDAAIGERAEPLTADGGPWCAACQGARWRKLERGPGNWTVELVRCADCGDSTVAHSRNVLARHAGLLPEQRSKTFTSFRPVRGVGQTVKLLAQWAQEPEGWIVLHGEAGSGKSHLGLAVANALIHRLRQVRWFYAPDLVLEGRERLLGAAGEQGYYAWLRELRDAPVLILDDLGAVKVSEWAIQELLEPLMDARYRAKLPTLVTMMRDPAYQREHLSEAIGRRMQDPGVCLVIHHGAPQWTGEKAA